MGRFLIIGVVIVLLMLLAMGALPKAVGRRIARPPNVAKTPRPGLAEPLDTLTSVDIETAILGAKAVHDELLDEAADLVHQARGAHHESLFLLDHAAAKVADALAARADSFPALILQGEIGVARVEYLDGAGALESLEAAAASFSAARDVRRGVIDATIGLGWSHLERGHRLEGAEAEAAYAAAAETFAAGFESAPQNVHVVRGWGLAIDGIRRSQGADRTSGEEWVERYYRALRVHQGGSHELFEWFRALGSAAEPLRLPMPQIRDI